MYREFLLNFPLIVTTPLNVYDHTHIEWGPSPTISVCINCQVYVYMYMLMEAYYTCE